MVGSIVENCPAAEVAVAVVVKIVGFGQIVFWKFQERVAFHTFVIGFRIGVESRIVLRQFVIVFFRECEEVRFADRACPLHTAEDDILP